MRKRRLSKALAMLLTAALTIPAAVPVAASESVADKEETVYVKTDASGEEKTVIVSDWLKNFAGEEEIKDATDLTDVENVKGNETFTRGKKHDITWNANGNDIYYQGSSDKNLPVSMKVTYYLDGKKIEPKKLIGKSGKVKIHYEYENHSEVTKTINGKQTTIYTPFTMITAAILNIDNFSNVKAKNGKVISDGSKHIVIGVAMPGLADSLNLKNTSIGSNFDIPEDFEITADVEDFQMTVTATVANSDTLSEFGLDDAADLSELTDSLKDLENATDKLCDGSGKLVKGIEKLVTASSKLKSGSKQIAVSTKQLASGLDKLVNGSSALKSGTSQLDSGVRQIIKELQNSTPSASEQAKLQENLQNAQSDITTQLTSVQKHLYSMQSTLQNDFPLIAKEIGKTATDVGTQEGTIKALVANSSTMSEDEKTALKEVADSLGKDVTSLQGSISSISAKAGSIGDDATAIGQNLTQTKSDLKIVAGCLTQIQNLLSTTKTSTAKLEAALKEVAAGTGQLKKSSKTLTASIKKLDAGAKTLNNGTKTAASGAKKLSKGASTLDNGMGQMSTGIATLKNGAVTLNEGMLTYRKDGIDKLVNTINDDAKDILDRVDAVMDEGENYQTFTKKASGTKGSVKFIIETEELEK